MRLAINLALVALIALFIWILISGIREPIVFNAEYKARQDAVTTRLKQVRSAQEIYNEATGSYAANFDTLEHVLRTAKIPTIKVNGDPDANSNVVITYDTTYTPCMDKINDLNINVDSLRYVPYAPPGTTFDIYADTTTYQSTLVHVVEVGVIRNKFMGKYADERYKKYDDTYNPDAFVKFGNRNAPNVTGNWE